MTERKKRAGILGGTFDPIHNMHLALAKTAAGAYLLDYVWIMPSGVSYLKTGTGVSSASDRYEMCRISCEGSGILRVSDLEIRRKGNTYTYETLEELNRLYPEYVHYFIAGADSLFFMEHWKHPERIFSSCIVLAAVRGDMDQDKLLEKIGELHARYGADIRQLQVLPSDLSSTFIRREVSEGRPIGEFVPHGVAEYIREHRLYA